MGIYAQFWHCHPAGLTEEFLSGPLEEFDSWLLETVAEFPEDIDASVYPLLQAVRTNGRVVLCASTASEAASVDRLMDAYFGMFCDMRRRDLKRAADQSLLRAAHYRGMVGTSENTARSVASELWNLMFTGRAVGRDTNAFPYASEDGVYHLAYWSWDEVNLLNEAFTVGPLPTEVGSRALAAAKNALAAAHTQRSGLIIEVG